MVPSDSSIAFAASYAHVIPGFLTGFVVHRSLSAAMMMIASGNRARITCATGIRFEASKATITA